MSKVVLDLNRLGASQIRLGLNGLAIFTYFTFLVSLKNRFDQSKKMSPVINRPCSYLSGYDILPRQSLFITSDAFLFLLKKFNFLDFFFNQSIKRFFNQSIN